MIKDSSYKKHIPTVILAIILIIYPFASGNNYHINVMTLVGLYTMIVVGLNLLMGYAGQISLGHAGFFGIGAYCSGLLNVKMGLPPWISAIIAIIFTAGIAYFIGIPTLKLKGHYLAMATLGFGEVVHVILSKMDWLTDNPDGLADIKPFGLFGIKFDSSFVMGQYFMAWIIAVAILVISMNITNSRVGRAFKAIHGSETAASSMGVNIAKYKVQVFVLSAVYAAVAGCLYAHFRQFIAPSIFQLHTSITLVTMVVIGGQGNIWGAVLGTVLLTWLPEWLTVAEEYDIMFYGILLMVVMIFMPDGLVGRLTTLFHRLWSRFSPRTQAEENG
ncbi:branched-chain amino acid ABC transporter permease [Candidatus Poribacteria bacterium]|nr:branched-chain amino acid ABC transporter permease [Candidatus Poribacteria bacterium]